MVCVKMNRERQTKDRRPSVNKGRAPACVSWGCILPMVDNGSGVWLEASVGGWLVEAWNWSIVLAGRTQWNNGRPPQPPQPSSRAVRGRALCGDNGMANLEAAATPASAAHHQHSRKLAEVTQRKMICNLQENCVYVCFIWSFLSEAKCSKYKIHAEKVDIRSFLNVFQRRFRI